MEHGHLLGDLCVAVFCLLGSTAPPGLGAAMTMSLWERVAPWTTPGGTGEVGGAASRLPSWGIFALSSYNNRSITTVSQLKIHMGKCQHVTDNLNSLVMIPTCKRTVGLGKAHSASRTTDGHVMQIIKY